MKEESKGAGSNELMDSFSIPETELATNPAAGLHNLSNYIYSGAAW